MRALSGIQPSGELHIGNYFGAIKQYVELQDKHEGFYFVANYHALTSIRDGSYLRDLTLEVAASFLALGVDPNKAVLYVQSDVPEVTELTWLLSVVTPMGLLQRAHAYKDKIAQGISPDHGLFAYPVLMAADILIVQSDIVPVGQDQKQHVEMTRDIAAKFNQAFGEEVFKLPEALIMPQVAVVRGTDGRKMSKSYNNTIGIFEPEEVIRRKIMSIVTDSKTVDEPKDPDNDPLFPLYRLFVDEQEAEAMAADYTKGGIGYGDMKKLIVSKFLEYFAEAREKKAQLDAHPDYVMDVLREGGRRARAEARLTLERAREAAGVAVVR